MPQLEGPANKIYNYVRGGLREIKQKKKKEEDWQQLLAQVLIFKKMKRKKIHCNDTKLLTDLEFLEAK